MIRHKQKFLHDPDNGIYGDCHRTALASLLDLPIDSVPHFMVNNPDGGKFRKHQREFLAKLGLYPIEICYDHELENFLSGIDLCNSGIKFLLSGQSANGTNHTVIAGEGKILHDPARDDSGIVGPCDDGFYWVTFIGKLL